MLENITNLEMIVISAVLYLIGSIPFAIISSKIFNLPDPRSFGSKNPGATNVLRSGNKYAAFLTLMGDGLKGLIPILFLVQMNIPIHQIYLLSFFFINRACLPYYLKFQRRERCCYIYWYSDCTKLYNSRVVNYDLVINVLYF